MHRVYFIIFVSLIHWLFFIQACKKSCNNNGFCYIENEIEKCKCLDRIYVGESCDILVDYCDKSPCKNGGKCVATPGLYNCFCSENFYGQNCTINSTSKHLGQVYLQYNHVAVNEDNNFLIILTDLGTVLSMVEMVTPEYAIAGGIFFASNHSHDFKNTNDIQSVAKNYNVPTSSLPTGNVFYHVGKYRMGSDGVTYVTLSITGVFDEILYYKWDFQFGRLENVGCNPLVTIVNCGTPHSPANVNANQSIFIEANIQRDCGRESTFSYDWSISNYFDTQTLQSFDETSRSLNIPAYGIQINKNDDDVFWLLKAIKLISLERSADGKGHGVVVKRCYIRIFSDKPIAKISGGAYQEYSYTQKIGLDGSESVDLSLHPKRDQRLSYVWRCSSNDIDEFCMHLNETVKTAIEPITFNSCWEH